MIYKSAERDRRANIKVMDIYAAKLATAALDIQPQSIGTSLLPLATWMDLSLRVEEKQYDYRISESYDQITY